MDDTQGTPIPGAPGFFMPSGLTPEEQDAYLLRLRFGPSLFKSGQDFTSAGGDENTAPGPSPYGRPGVVNPAVMQGFLQAAKTQSPTPQTHSEQMLQKILNASGGGNASGATPEEAQPTNESEYNALYPQNVYDLPEDRAKYEQYAKAWGGERAYEGQQETQKTRAEAVKNKAGLQEAQTEKDQAQADKIKDQMENPETYGKGGAAPGPGGKLFTAADFKPKMSPTAPSAPAQPVRVAEQAPPATGPVTQPPPGFVFDPADKTGNSIIKSDTGVKYKMGIDPRSGKRGWVRS